MVNHYQLCPKCQGQGVVGIQPGIPLNSRDGFIITTSGIKCWRCDVCNGMKVLLVDDGESDLHPIGKGYSVTWHA